MKKIFWLLPIALMFSVLSAGNASAVPTGPNGPTWDPVNFTIATYKSDFATPTSEYQVGNTAWLLITVPEIADVSLANSFWNDSTPLLRLTNTYNPVPGHVFWVEGPNFTATDVGTWNINANYTNLKLGIPPTYDYQTQSLKFSVVTPEPAAVVLYAIGGIPLAFAFFSRRKPGFALTV